MANKTVTIKNATNKELTSLLFRLRQEHEALRLTRELKIKSVPNPNGHYPSYSIPEGFSTETIVSNGKSIKTMDDEELALFLDRLRNENEVARIIADIREMNNPMEPYSDNQNYEGISMDTPVADLYHFGIPGMKWGVRRSPEQLAARAARKQERQLVKADMEFGKESNVKNLTVKLTNQLYEKPEFIKELNSLSDSIQKKYSKFDNRDLSDKMLQRGYRDLCEKYLKDNPESYSPSKRARVTWATLEPEGGRGQTYLKPVLVTAEVKHSSDEFDLGFTGKFKVLLDGTLSLVEDISKESVEHSDVDAYLEHFGILGMKWGVRRARGADGTVSSNKSTPKDMAVRKKSFETGATAAREAGNAINTFSKRKENEFSNQKRAEAKKMSEKELKDAINRLNLEQQYRNLSTRDIEIGKTTVQDFLAVSGNVLTVAAAGAGLALTIKQLASKV